MEQLQFLVIRNIVVSVIVFDPHWIPNFVFDVQGVVIHVVELQKLIRILRDNQGSLYHLRLAQIGIILRTQEYNLNTRRFSLPYPSLDDKLLGVPSSRYDGILDTSQVLGPRG